MNTLAEYLPLVNSQASLVGLPTISIPVNAIIKYIRDTTLALEAWQIRSGNTGLVPSDYNATTNNKSWFRI